MDVSNFPIFNSTTVLVFIFCFILVFSIGFRLIIHILLKIFERIKLILLFGDVNFGFLSFGSVVNTLNSPFSFFSPLTSPIYFNMMESIGLPC